MITGDEIPQVLYLYDSTGSLVTYSTYAAMQAAGWSITFYDEDAVALSSQPTITMPAAGSNGRHQMRYIMPNGVWTAKVVNSNALFMSAPAEFSGEGTSYDIDSIGGLIAAGSGVPITETSILQTHEMYDGNSIDVSCTIPDAALSALGVASLAALDQIVAEIKIDSVDSDQAASVSGLTETITSDVPGAYIVRVTLDAFPAALAVPDGGQQTLSCTLQVKLIEGTKVLTANATKILVRWKATST